MSRRRSILMSLTAAVLVGTVGSGCRLGGLATQDTIARQPAGLRVMMELDRRRLYGELLEVRADGVLLHVDRGVSAVEVEGSLVWVGAALIPEQFRAGTDMPLGEEKGRLVRFDAEADREWLRSLSRFPYGMTPEVQLGLLAAYGETGVHLLGGSAGAAEEEAFLREVQGASALYADPEVAVRHGYRRVGPDFPGMGEHWVNPGRVLSGGIDPGRPQILTYVDAPGGLRLTGMAFAVPLSADETLPAAPVPEHVWHDHGGSLDEESLILESPHSAEHGAHGPRLAMFHAWLWPENPEGAFAQNNWALPWVRAGLEPPDRPDPAVARALSLGAGGAAYYRRLLNRVAGLEGPTVAPGGASAKEAIDRAVVRASERADAVLLDAAADGRLEAGDRQRLRAAWWGLWDDLRATVDGAVWARLEPAYREWGAPEARGEVSGGAPGRRSR